MVYKHNRAVVFMHTMAVHQYKGVMGTSAIYLLMYLDSVTNQSYTNNFLVPLFDFVFLMSSLSLQFNFNSTS